MGFRNSTEEEHPAFGLLSFHRITGHPGKLFGSHLADHHGYIQMRLGGARLVREGTEDLYFGSLKNAIVEVNLSAAQFAELITTMNQGSGTPCTITRVEGRKIEAIPEESLLEHESIYNKVSEELYEKTQKLRSAEKRLDEILSKKGTITKKDRQEIRGLYKSALQHFESNTSFAVKCFSEAAEKVVTESKANVDTFVTGVLTKMGLEALKDKFTKTAFAPSLEPTSVADVQPSLVGKGEE